MRILILDDMQVRHDGFKIHFKGHQLFHALTFVTAQDIMISQSEAKEPIEMCCLDHDLSDAIDNADSFYNEQGQQIFFNGKHFAFWLSNQDFCPSKIWIHSWNESEAQRMSEILSTRAEVKVQAYRSPKE